ncbi:GATA transcription factor 12-like [Gastrolobium bilobum]|uniref:GATA transcription factor 12-like n=1 Tax=Gastrolobium bilobum TaxID=150636 RepID=UPI002AB2E5A1|nr:GATA transcription factor 12-like [Gastrolobium bilobum]
MEAPKFFQSSFCPQFPSDNKSNNNASATDHFIVEDLLDFSNDDAIITDTTFDSVPGISTDSSTVTAVDSCNSSSFSPNLVADIGCRNISDGNLSGDLCVPYDDLAELEWLSNFVEESFSSEDLQKLQLISGMKARHDDASKAREFHSEPNRNNPIFNNEVSVPAKARSKRTRGPPCNWTSRLLVLSPTTSSCSDPDFIIPTPTSPSVAASLPSKKPAKVAPRKKEGGDGSGGDGRKCLHCATDKTPQWRTGPMGPKTLCNACGVRYKSGRLVPEYRPAASPTFVLTKHSNSHRKVLELRRQKEMVRAQQQQFLQHHHHQNMMFDVSNGDDYLIHQHVGPDFTQLI